MRANLFLHVFLSFTLAMMSCRVDQDEPTIVGPEPEPRINYLGRDSITTGDYRGIAINTSTDDAFKVLEAYRENKTVVYLGAVNSYFADVSDLKNRLQFFDWMVLDETFDTPTGVQFQLAAGQITSIRLNQGTALGQWPEAADLQVAIKIGDAPEILYKKLVALSKQAEYTHKFQRVVLGAKYTYALYDAKKAQLPWAFIYDTRSQGVMEQVRVYFKDKKVDYIIVDRFQQY
ncbi:hypothetical protein MUK70_03645 [Dyadobacter chenwenxiniae]|uniref:Uncharacterized protein n=1 Tax=Dyadobacter chenwenxiniae TaxID=2906456 RepID=A0A9X1PUH2_9BACT|nr:hypothetical protein [Dyadobacter chenwenxiniae]MCF0065838.1 hypothetical protein [Dyadobacter chenwenxiniae]UON84084.1 hypothetical protein MUK70_03645 [Dyadobacter chenwenxiniae]